MAIDLLPSEKDIARIVRSIIELNQGRGNTVGQVTLTVSAATTTVNFVNCSRSCAPILVPITANASAEIGNGTIWISAVNNGSFTIAHANSAVTGRTFLFACVGG